MRLVLACLAAAGVGVLGALILGEYSFAGPVVMGSGVVLGLMVGEAAIGVYRRPDVRLGLACVLVSMAAMVWAAWISTARDLSFVGAAGWTAIGLAGAAGLLRTGGFRRGAGSPAQAPAPAASPEDPTA